MRTLLATALVVALLALSAPPPATALIVGTGGYAAAHWRSGPITFMGHPDAYRVVTITISKGLGSSSGASQCVWYRDLVYVPGQAEELSQTVSQETCAPAQPQFSPLLTWARLAPTQVLTYSYATVPGGPPPSYGSVSISLDVRATGPGVPANHFAFFEPGVGELYLGWTRPGSASAWVNGTPLGPSSEASLHWGSVLQR